MKEFEILTEKYLSGTLNPEEAQRLEAQLSEHQDLRKTFAELMVLHAEMVDQLSGAEASNGNIVPLKQPHPQPKYAMLAAVAALVAILLALTFQYDGSSPSAPAIATVESTDFAVWGECTVPTAQGSQLSSGRLELMDGLATLRFASGAQVTLEGPVELQLLTAMKVKLEHGLLVSEIPESAHGFTILTPQAEVIDHGTTFLTKVSNNGDTTTMDVLNGEVELIDKHTRENRRFFGGEGAILSAKNLGFTDRSHQSGEILLTDGTSTNSTAESLVSISTREHGGKDGTVVKSNTDFHYDPRLVMVKNTQDEFARKAYLGFDCSSIDLQEAKSAELVMNFVYSGYGAAALSKTSQFAIWGIRDDQLDAWKQGRIPWEDGPANVNAADTLDTNDAIRLCEFTISRGRHEAEYRVGSASLLDFIQADQNRFITLVVVCEDFDDSNNLVYSMVGRMHPSGNAPRLDFRF